jgi:hypothetical protein
MPTVGVGHLPTSAKDWTRHSGRPPATGFFAEGGEEKKAAEQIFVLPMNGGEAKQITSVPLGVEQFAWRPGGAFVAFSSPDEPPNKADIEKHHDLFEVGDNSFLDTSAPTPSHRGWSPPQVARRSGSPPAHGACRRTRTILHRRFLGRLTASRSASLAKSTRTSAIPIKPCWRSWTLTAVKCGSLRSAVRSKASASCHLTAQRLRTGSHAMGTSTVRMRFL